MNIPSSPSIPRASSSPSTLTISTTTRIVFFLTGIHTDASVAGSSYWAIIVAVAGWFTSSHNIPLFFEYAGGISRTGQCTFRRTKLWSTLFVTGTVSAGRSFTTVAGKGAASQTNVSNRLVPSFHRSAHLSSVTVGRTTALNTLAPALWVALMVTTSVAITISAATTTWVTPFPCSSAHHHTGENKTDHQ